MLTTCYPNALYALLKARSLAAGFQIHLPKPVEAADLVSAVATAAGRKTAR